MLSEGPGNCPRLAFRQATRRYAGVSAVDHVSLEIASCSFVALVGPSGSGKSTLLRLVNRLEPLDYGSVAIDGREVSTFDLPGLRRGIGYVFQDGGLFPHMTVAENIALVARIAGTPPVDVAAALDRVGLPESYASRRPAELSGGEAQRVGIARALAGDRKLLLMDEPFGALDPVTRDALGRTCRQLHDELKLTTVLVTHDMAEALLLADRIVVMAHGRIVADASPREMLGGHAGPEAAALVAVPREQARRLHALEQ